MPLDPQRPMVPQIWPPYPTPVQPFEPEVSDFPIGKMSLDDLLFEYARLRPQVDRYDAQITHHTEELRRLQPLHARSSERLDALKDEILGYIKLES